MGARELANYSYEDYLQIVQTTPENERYELIFGHIYAMAGASAIHQDVVLNIASFFKSLKKETNCFPRVAPFDLKLECAGSINVVQPDILVYCNEKELPCAIFEVLSPSTAYKDKTVKKDLYEQCGVLNYFLVDPEAKTVDKFLLKSKKYHYIGCYGIDDKMEIECFDMEVDVKEMFE
ncbi:Uma2 family endonuclease [Hydrogenimonas thermophila]|uniref:Endonuclease, Uma2 family (Restriction endonuclease fold) n=1 Tax=Hydrogenimonas thermophila TaxID=223786 RepID=A0A1I5M4X8_9BACT|nr:Uma2 family endonuclease [Hydrogenimonas thermophila]WOE70551.1 Uma2 family endonuclease [Hydrogenimonas thermophila]WOE73067.1 Uma2 family endonuclease [Hydrogenimonas thermophila]SFP04585.1 Endonuclease, Uma2 family (restriction endonuclease fold) [Hydrogenimonas thermophila]